MIFFLIVYISARVRVCVGENGSRQAEDMGLLNTATKSNLCIYFLGIVRPPNFHIHVSVSDLYFPRIGSHTVHIFLQQNRQTDPGYI